MLSYTDSLPATGHPMEGTRAQFMLSSAVQLAHERGVSQRELSERLGYKTSVVLSHMASGRVPIPVDRAVEIACALELNAPTFLIAVLEQRFPNVAFQELLNFAYSSSSVVSQLEAIAHSGIDHLPRETIQVLCEVVAAVQPQRRWLTPHEQWVIETIRKLRPNVSEVGLKDEELRAIERALPAR